MKLQFIALDKLSISKTNMRNGRKAPDVADLLPTVRTRGVLQTLLVRPQSCPEPVEGCAGMFEIVAGRRRYHAARIVAEERAANDTQPEGDGPPDPDVAQLPCAILEDGDDADAIEASMIENMARLDADEVTQWETFTRLVREGRGIEDIALTFGLPDLMIRRVLALGNLLPRIRQMYAKGDIDRVTVRHLTLASKRQQQDWLALVDDAEKRAPMGAQLKAWLFGGQSIPLRHALFDVEASGLATVTDLFGEDPYFADAGAFWTAQNAAIEERRAGFVAAGWGQTVVIPTGEYFESWKHEKTAKRKGGRVYIDVHSSGEVTIHEGYLPRKEIERQASGGTSGTGEKTVRSEITSTLQTYVDLHRHAAVRAALTGHPSVALRLMVAHAIGGSHLWRVTPEPQATQNDAVKESLETSPAEAEFDERRRAVLALLGFDPEDARVVPIYGGRDEVAIFRRLLDLPDAAVMDVIAVVIGETLASGSSAVEAVGMQIGVDMARFWQADAAFLDLIREKEVLTAMVAEVAGPEVAEANAGEKIATMKQIVRDHLDGTNGRIRRENWVPRWMAFPPSAYTGRGGVGTVRAHAKALKSLTPGPDEEPIDGAGDPPDGSASEPVTDPETEAQPEEEVPPLAA